MNIQKDFARIMPSAVWGHAFNPHREVTSWDVVAAISRAQNVPASMQDTVVIYAERKYASVEVFLQAMSFVRPENIRDALVCTGVLVHVDAYLPAISQAVTRLTGLPTNINCATTFARKLLAFVAPQAQTYEYAFWGCIRALGAALPPSMRSKVEDAYLARDFRISWYDLLQALVGACFHDFMGMLGEHGFAQVDPLYREIYSGTATGIATVCKANTHMAWYLTIRGYLQCLGANPDVRVDYARPFEALMSPNVPHSVWVAACVYHRKPSARALEDFYNALEMKHGEDIFSMIAASGVLPLTTLDAATLALGLTAEERRVLCPSIGRAMQRAVKHPTHRKAYNSTLDELQQLAEADSRFREYFLRNDVSEETDTRPQLQVALREYFPEVTSLVSLLCQRHEYAILFKCVMRALLRSVGWVSTSSAIAFPWWAELRHATDASGDPDLVRAYGNMLRANRAEEDWRGLFSAWPQRPALSRYLVDELSTATSTPNVAAAALQDAVTNLRDAVAEEQRNRVVIAANTHPALPYDERVVAAALGTVTFDGTRYPIQQPMPTPKPEQDNKTMSNTISNRTKDTLSKTATRVKNATVHGAQVAASDTAADLILELAKATMPEQYDMLASTERGRLMLKYGMATMLISGVEGDLLPDSFDGVGAAAELVIEATTRDFIQLYTKEVAPIMGRLAEVGKQLAKQQPKPVPAF